MSGDSTVKQGCGESSRAAIEKLREDNRLLKEELLLENKFSVTPTTANASMLIANLNDQSEVYTRKVNKRSCQKCSSEQPSPQENDVLPM